MKKDKLYIANRWNKGQFAKNVDRDNKNIFDGLTGSMIQRPSIIPVFDASGLSAYQYNNPNMGYMYYKPMTLNTPQLPPHLANSDWYKRAQTMQPLTIDTSALYPQIDSWRKDGWGEAADTVSSDSKGFNWGKAGSIAAGVGASAAAIPMFNDPYKEDKKTDFYDMADPTYHLAGGRESGVGNALGTAGKGLFQAGASTGNPWLMVAGAGAKILGGLTNAAFGVKWNDKNINTVKNNIAGMKQAGHGFNRLSTNSDLANAMSNTNMGFDFSNSYIGKDGWFNSKATRKARELRTQQNTARGFATHAFADAANKIDKNRDDMAQINSAAYGGPLDMMSADGMGALGYGFMSDYLNMKNRQTGVKDKIGGLTGVPNINPFAGGGGIEIKHPGRLTELKKRTGKTEAELWAEGKPEVRKMITFARNARKWKKAYGGFLDASNTLFALGGDTQMHGGDYTTGLMHIDEGGSHEENPNEGVQLGVDSQGVPNMVEEGETVFNDYVFSNRIEIDDQTKDRFHIGKKKKLTYADLSKRLEKEASERPNDPISKASLKKQLTALQEEQERQKQEMEARRASEELAAMTPDERELVLREMQRQLQAQAQDQAAMEEQAVQQQGLDQAAQQQAMQQQMMQQQGYGYPDEQAMMQQQMAQQQMMAQQGAPVGDMGYACGGKMNKYADGGVLKFLQRLGYPSVSAAEKAGWKPSDFGNYSSWSDIDDDTKLPEGFKWSDDFSKRIQDPATKAALSVGWNPMADLIGRRWYEGDAGSEAGWSESVPLTALNAAQLKEYAKRYPYTIQWAIDNGKIAVPVDGKTVSTRDIVDAAMQAPDRKKTDEWLRSDIKNLGTYLNEVSKQNPAGDTKFIQKWSPYGTFGEGNRGFTLRDDLTDEEKRSFQDLFWKSRNDNMIGVMHNSMHDPLEASQRYVIDDDGNATILLDSDLSNYTQVGSPYSWGDVDADTNRTLTFYTRKGSKAEQDVKAATSGATGQAKSGANPVDANGNRMWIPRPVHQPTWMRYALGPAAGLGLMAAGVGKPDYSNLDAALEIGRGPTALADWMPVHERQWFTPFDIWSQQNRQGNVSAGTARYLVNNSGPLGMRNAALLANAAQNRQALGALGIQAKEYNNKFNDAVQRFNQSTSLANQQAYDSTSQFNASAMNQGKNVRAQMAMDAARQKMLMDQNWAQGIYGNVSGLFKGIGDIGRENYQRNMIADMAAQGIFGPMSPSTYISDGFIDWERNPQYQAAEGGKIRRKKNKRRGGLTY